MGFFTRDPSLGKQGFDSGAHKTMENQDLVDGVFESPPDPPDPSISHADFATQGGYRRSNDYSGTTNAAGTAGSGANSIFGNSSSGSLMSNGGRHSGPEVVRETPKTTSSNPGMFSIGTSDPHRGPAVVIDRDTSSGSSTRSSGIFGSGKTTDSSSGSSGSNFSSGNSSTSADTSSSGSSLLGARGSQHTAGSMTGGRNNAPAPKVFANSGVQRPPSSATTDAAPVPSGKVNSTMLHESGAAVRDTARDTVGHAASSVGNAARGTAQAMSDTGAAVRDTGAAATRGAANAARGAASTAADTAGAVSNAGASARDATSSTVRGAADSVADTLHGVEGAVRNTGASAANAVHETGKGYGIGSNDASRYGAAGSSQSAGSSIGDGASRLAKNVGSSVASGGSVTDGVASSAKSSVKDSAKEAVKDTGSEILGRETGTGLLNAARETGSGIASSLRGSARESVRDNSESRSAGSVLRDTSNYGSPSVDSHRTNPHASTNSGTSGASRLSDVGTARRGTGVASNVAAGEPIDKRATIGRSSGDAGHAVGYDVDETVAERNLRY